MCKTNLENFVLRKRLVDENSWQHYVYHQADTSALHGIPTITMSENNWDRDSYDFATTTQVQGALQLILSSVARYNYLMCCCKITIKSQTTIHPRKTNFMEIFT